MNTANFNLNFINMRSIVSATLFLVNIITYTQVTQDWVSIYQVTGTGCAARFIETDNADNIYVAGYSWGGSSFNDYLLVKYNSNGQLLWVRNYDTTVTARNDEVLGMTMDANYIYITGSSRGDIATIKYNFNGDIVWIQRYDGPSNDDRPVSVKTDYLGNVYVCGFAYFQGTTGNDFVIIKYNSQGNFQWNKFYDFNQFGDTPFSMELDNTGNVYVTGRSYQNFENTLLTTVKYDQNGILQWHQHYDSSYNSEEKAVDIAIDFNNNVYVTGEGDQIITIKYNSNGAQQWVRKLSYVGQGEEIICDQNNNVYVGYTGSTIPNSGLNICVLKYNPNGDLLWNQELSYGDFSTDIFKDMVIDNYNNIYVTGFSDTGNITGEDYVTARFSANGIIEWKMRYHSVIDYGTCITYDNNNKIYVSGIVDGSDIHTIKYNQHSIGITNISGEIPNSYGLSQNFPNPFNPSTKIRFSLPRKEDYVYFRVYDLLGKELKSEIFQQLYPGVYEIGFDGSKLSSGIYIYSLQTGNFRNTKKMILIK